MNVGSGLSSYVVSTRLVEGDAPLHSVAYPKVVLLVLVIYFD